MLYKDILLGGLDFGILQRANQWINILDGIKNTYVLPNAQNPL